jgi:TonB family protein
MLTRVRTLVCLFLAGCSVGAPFGFSSGDHWVFPLVGPLEDGLLVTPVTVRGRGPYLFGIDPDATVTAIDQQVAKDASLLVGTGPRRVDESETGRTWLYAELRELKIGSLTIERRDAMVFPSGLYDAEGRRLHGILGRDVIADSLVFGFDRDQGIATLSTVQAFETPPQAIAIKYDSVSSRSAQFVSSRQASSPSATGASTVDRDNTERQHARARPGDAGAVMPVPRRLARAQLAGAAFTMHLDLGAVTSQLPESRWPKAGLASADAQLALVDEAGSRREISSAGTASEVALGSARAERVAFVPFVDKRWGTEGVEGALGLDFFQPYAVYAHWDRRTYYLKPRGDVAAQTAARIGRWGTSVPGCTQPGCLTAELIATDGGVVLRAVRDARAANLPLEVYLGVTPAAGRTVAPLVVELPAGVDQLTVAVPPEYAGATLAALDASPFPRACAGNRGCVAMLGGPLAAAVELSPTDAPGAVSGKPARAAPPSVVIDKLRRVTGDAAILPSDDARKAAEGKPLASAIIRVCLRADGTVESTRVLKSSGVAAYDEQLQTTIRASWTFEPPGGDHQGGQVDNQTAAVCTSATFIAR